MVGGHSYLIQRSYQVRKGYQKGWPPDYDTDNALAVRLYRAQVPRDSREAKTTLSHDSMLNLCFRVRLCPFSLLHLPHLLSTLRTKTWHWMPLYACLYTSSECQITFWCPADVCDAQQAGILFARQGSCAPCLRLNFVYPTMCKMCFCTRSAL